MTASHSSVTPAMEALRTRLLAMPPVAAMQVRIDGLRDERLQLSAPLNINLNDKGCAFGGSLVSLMTLAGWGRVTLALSEAGHEADVFVADSQVRYLLPVWEDLVAEAGFAPDEVMEDFVSDFTRKGKARAQIQARIVLADGRIAATLEGRFAAFAKH